MSGIFLSSTGGTSLVVSGVGPDLSIKGLIQGTGISFIDNGSSIRIINDTDLYSTGGNSLVVSGSGPDLSIKGLITGTGISIISNGTSLKIYQSSVIPTVWLVTDVKSSGTNGGASVSGTWTRRDLNTLSGSSLNNVTLASNQLTITAGTYHIQAHAPALNAGGGHRIKLRNITDSTDTLIGSTANTNSATTQTDAWLEGFFTITSSKVFEIQHIVSFGSSSGFGIGVPPFGISEIYTVVRITQM